MFFKLKDMNFKNKKVLIRVDFNVPIKNQTITDDSRIIKALPTIEYVLKNKPKQIILCSHLGRPDGEYNPELSLKPVCDRLTTLLKQNVHFETNPRINNIVILGAEKIVMLENLRFDKLETEGDDEFSKKLASHADLFVLDAFGTAHRAHSSITGVQKYIPSCAGYLMEKEIKFLKEEMQDPKKPFVAIISGEKTDKINVINTLLKKIDILIIGGVLANTFIKAKGYNIGNSKYDPNSLNYAKEILQKYPNKIILPVDYILGESYSNTSISRVAGINDNINGYMIMDIGPYSITRYKKILSKAKTIVFAGPVGVFEFEKFSRGTHDLMDYISNLKATTIIGGGDTGKAAKNFGCGEKMSLVSTGGGASLELLAGHELPGITALEENYKRNKK